MASHPATWPLGTCTCPGRGGSAGTRTYLSSHSFPLLRTSLVSGQPLRCLQHTDTRLNRITDAGDLRLKQHRDFPGGPVVKTSPSKAGGAGSIPGRGAKIPRAS